MTEQIRFRFLSLGLGAILSVASLASAHVHGHAPAPVAAAAPAPAAVPAPAAAPASAVVPATGMRAYQVDAVHSSVGFSIRHLISRVAGNFREFNGTLNVDPKNIAGATGEFVVKTASIDTGNEKRDGHLRSADFFDVEKFPEIKLVLGSVTSSGDGSAVVKGDFTMLGVTKPVEFAVSEIAFADMGETGLMGFSGLAKINRKDFGMVWNKALDAGSLALGDEVTLVLLLEAKAKLAAAPAAAGL